MLAAPTTACTESTRGQSRANLRKKWYFSGSGSLGGDRSAEWTKNGWRRTSAMLCGRAAGSRARSLRGRRDTAEQGPGGSNTRQHANK